MKILIGVLIVVLLGLFIANLKGRSLCVGCVFNWRGKYPELHCGANKGSYAVWINGDSQRELIMTLINQYQNQGGRK